MDLIAQRLLLILSQKRFTGNSEKFSVVIISKRYFTESMLKKIILGLGELILAVAGLMAISFSILQLFAERFAIGRIAAQDRGIEF